jgi:glycosyltransferase involved in cell wall biosynthesis
MVESLPKISVITVSFNQAQFIRDCIESVKNQDYPNIEHIIIDGGSTDGTVDILKEYSHLNWVSEPDNGQTHALNKGFLKATGQIIGWLNSDDYYTPGALKIVASELKNSSVLLGGGNIVDRVGNITGYVPNIERNWFDILKNWIYHSSFLQPAVFFTKEVIDAVKLQDGNYLDEDLHYVMDYELWLRIAQKYPFSKRVNQPLACFRVYEESKTGTAKFSTDHEIRRVYQKYSSIVTKQEYSTSFILPINQFDRSVFETIDSLNSQSYSDFEVILAPFSTSINIKDSLEKLRGNFPRIMIRSIPICAGNFIRATEQAVKYSTGLVCMLLTQGSVVSNDFNLNLTQYFSSLSLGAIIPSAGQCDKLKPFCIESENGVSMFNAQALLTEATMPFNIAFRKTALLELQNYFDTDDSLLFIRSELFNLLYKGWGINISNILEVKNLSDKLQITTEDLKGLLPKSIAKMLCDNYDQKQNDPFHVVRAEHGFSLDIPVEYVDSCRAFITS